MKILEVMILYTDDGVCLNGLLIQMAFRACKILGSFLNNTYFRGTICVQKVFDDFQIP